MTNEKKMRPCRPGDVLARERAACGAEYWITVHEPPRHPTSGTTQDRSVCLGLVVAVPAGAPDDDYSVRPDLIDESVSVLGSDMGRYWGCRGETEGKPQTRCNRIWRHGDDIHAMERDLREVGILAIQSIQSLADRHAESVRQQEAARAQQYARRMVEDTEPTESHD